MSPTKPTLSPTELQTFLDAHPEWPLLDGKLTREWTFATFPDAIAFVNRVAALAEQANHHPDIDIRYNKVLLALTSHDAGGITARDAKMAAQITSELPAPKNLSQNP
jgi:4a-hydroxytetrahydrobiopterin dehydratase